MTEQRNERLQRLARVSCLACYLGGAALALVTTWSIVTRSGAELYGPLGFPTLAHVESWQHHLARAIATLPAIAASLALLALGRAYQTIGTGLLFDENVTRSLKRFSLGVLVASVLGMLTPTSMGLILSIGAPPGQGRLVIQLSSTNVIGLVLALGIWTFARLLAEARRVKQENEEFV